MRKLICKKYFLSFFIILIYFTCNKKDKTNQKEPTIITQLFQIIPSNESGLDFINTIEENEDINYLHYGYIYNGSGVAVGDINNDGLSDVYFSSNLDFNKLYLNQGNLKFKDVTETAGVNGGDGYKSGVTMADINQDGWLDIFVCKTAIKDSNYRKKALYINNQNGTFTDQIAEFGLDDRSYTTQAYFFDSDLDGDLDVYFVNHPMNFEDNNYIKPVVNNSNKTKNPEAEFVTDRFFENRNGKFIDQTQEANIVNEAFGLSAVVGDFNNDNLPDIYVANDFLQPDYLYINLGHNKFKESFSTYFNHCPFSSMGTDYADINNDGCPDLMVVDMTPLDPERQKNLLMTQNYDRFQLMLESGLKAQYSINSLQLGNCGKQFSDIAFLTKMAYTDWSWTPLIADFDNDGNKDIFITNGYLHDVMHSDYNRYKLDSLEKLYNAGMISKLQWINHMPSVKIKDFLFKNNGNLNFTDVSKEWNSGPESFSHGASYADLDNDGDLDLIVCNINDKVTLLKNNSNSNYIRFQFKGKGIQDGTKITLQMSNGTQQFASFNQTRGFLSKSEDALHFGLGKESTINSALVEWTDGKSLIINTPGINKTISIDKKQASIHEKKILNKNIFSTQTLPTILSHLENSFIDFKREPLLLHKLSEEGPAVSVADLNNDGLSDLYIGGAKQISGKLLIQDKSGQFKSIIQSLLNSDAKCEDVASIFIDVNNDHLLDLYVVSGGNEYEKNAKEYQDRLYINKGNLNFEKSNLIEKENLSGSCVSAGDIDNDGDMDLFIGSRANPGRYGETPEHLLLVNEQGKFTNQLSNISLEINKIGMITDAHWADLNNDKQLELIICGEFMPIHIYSFQNKKLVNTTAQWISEGKSGLWQKLFIQDLNNDGYLDIIAGNIGLNTHLKAEQNNTLQLCYSDFDKNGSFDALLCQKRNNKSYPIHYRDRLLDQMVFLKKKFTRFEPFSKASIDEIFTSEQKFNMTILEAQSLKSIALINQSGKSFSVTDLPIETQFSPIKGIASIDYNQDHQLDLIVVGNFYGTDAQFGRYDASHGCLLEFSQNTYKFVNASKSGLDITGDVRGIFSIVYKGKKSFLISKNNSSFTLIQKN